MDTTEQRDRMLFDSELVEAVLNRKFTDILSIAYDILGDEADSVSNRPKDLGVEWIDEGDEFEVGVHTDGSGEYILVKKYMKWITA